MPKIVRKNQKKREIALAAIDLFAENGFAKTSVDSIAKAADVGKGTVYLYFNSKEEIIPEIWDYVCEVLDEQKILRYQEAKNVSEKIAIFFDYSPLHEDDMITKLVKVFGMNLSIILTTSHKKLQDEYKRKTHRDIDELRKLFKEGIYTKEFKEFDVDLMAEMYENMFRGSLVNSMCQEEDIEQITNSIHKKRDFILSLIKN